MAKRNGCHLKMYLERNYAEECLNMCIIWETMDGGDILYKKSFIPTINI